MNSALPTRRDEEWRYSDLSAALRGETHVLREGRDIIERLAPGTQRMTIPAGVARVFVETMDSTYLDARSFEFRLEPGAQLDRIIIQTAAGPALSMARVHAGEGARFRQFIYAEGAKMARLETRVAVDGRGAEIELNGVYAVQKNRHADLTSVIHMRAPSSQARQLIKGVARAGGCGVFQGKILVDRAAQQTDARQYHHALLLEDGAEVFAKPELEIFADNVACAHGNTSGGLDEAALFYMRARGIPQAQARAMLTEAFVLEALPDWLGDNARETIESRLHAWLEGAS